MATVAERFEFRGVIYEARWVKCNNKRCSTCPHGPYWYAVIAMFGQKPVTRYIGKQLKGPAAEHYTNHYTGGNVDGTQ